jgi:hypothetical protein
MMDSYRRVSNADDNTDQPVGIKLAEDDYIKVRYDAKAMRWIANRPSRIKYSTAKELIKQYRYRRVCHRR